MELMLLFSCFWAVGMFGSNVFDEIETDQDADDQDADGDFVDPDLYFFEDQTFLGGAGDDDFSGSIGNDTLEGGAGNDTLTGNWGIDTIFGGDGNDVIIGADHDYHWSEPSDQIDAGAGDDIISFADGSTVTGGSGADSFTAHESLSNNLVSEITDFDPAEDSLHIDLGISRDHGGEFTLVKREGG